MSMPANTPISKPFTIRGKQFCLAAVDGGESGPDMSVLVANGTGWDGWGGNDRSIIVENTDDAKIMAHGSLYAFTQWLISEAVRRATLYMDQQTPLPDPNNRIARLEYAVTVLMKPSADGGTLTLPPGPLP